MAKNDEEAESFKYGIQDLAKELGGAKPNLVRIKLRRLGIEKAGKSYGWNSKAELDAVVTQLKTPSRVTKEPAVKKPAKSAPAAKKPLKKAA